MTSLFPELPPIERTPAKAGARGKRATTGDSTDRPAHAIGAVRVAVERGIDRYPDGLTYLVPAELGELRIGERVIVPLGRGNADTFGYVVDHEPLPGAEERQRLKFVARRDRTGVALPTDLVELGRWISSYYCCPLGMTFAGILPAAVKRGIGVVKRTLIDLPPTPAAASSDPAPPDDGNADPHDIGGHASGEADPAPTRKSPVQRGGLRSAQQRRVVELLASLPSSERPVELHELARRAELRTPAPIRGLVQRGLLVATQVTAIEAAWAVDALDAAPPPSLSPRQQEVISAIGSSLGRGFSSHLLFGVTGSGKTEVYIRLIEQVVASGRAALVLVPEISLTPQTGGRLVRRLPQCTVAILHSGLTAAQRHHQWALVASGDAHVVLGARSAVLAPFPEQSLGLIIVDEEHDSSYKQDQAPRYHGRDVALRRGQLANCPVVLGSATPSLESWHNATVRHVHHLHEMPDRAPGLTVPRVEIVDFTEEVRARRGGPDGQRIHLIGPRLEQAIAETLQPANGRPRGQVLLLLNRRGYANYIACTDHRCGWLMECDHCDATMVCHLDARVRGGSFLRCHHCLAEQRQPNVCPRCGKPITVFGLGTQRVEEELERKFPILERGRTLVRVDSDAMHGSRELHEVLRRFGKGEVLLLVGTQMIAKGLDFPGVRLVGVVNGDTAINLPDFRASERTFQLISQVAGRCGRGMDPGRAIVQTFNPGLEPIVRAAMHDYTGFAARELEERAQCRLPPTCRMARLVVRHLDFDTCVTTARDLTARLRDICDRIDSRGGLRVIGPAACPIARIANRHRQQVELIGATAPLVQQVLAEARRLGVVRPGEELAVDVDPVVLM